MHPEDASPPRVVERRGDLGGPWSGQRDGQVEVELLAEDGADGEEAQCLGVQQVEAPRQNQRGPPRRLHVGHGARVDLPALGHVPQRARLDHPSQHGRGHERAAVGQPHDRFDGFGRERTGHRLAELLDAPGVEGPQRHARRRIEVPQRVAGRYVLRAERRHDDDAAARLGHLERLPAVEQGQRHGVGPLAVVEEDQHGTRRLPQGLEQGQQGLDAARLAVLLGTESSTVDRAEQWAERRQGGRGRVGPVAELGAEAAGEPAVDSAHDDSVSDALEHLERPRGGLVDALAAQHDDVTLCGVQRQLVEQPGLARAGVGLHQHQPLQAATGPGRARPPARPVPRAAR